MQYALAIHGGAGTILRSHMTPEREQAYLEALEDAISAGESCLKSGGDALDAVELAVRSMEDNPLFNAGRGSVFTADGKHEMDACIMNGADLRAGAVSGLVNMANPVSVARAVMEKTDHVLLSGSGAFQFATSLGIEPVPDEYFFVQERFEQLQQARASGGTMLDHSDDKKFGTVGAVARDVRGNLAAATSTGGMTNKQFGRIGDSPIIGSGTYANNNTCAISCTGHGEFFIRSVVAYDISCLMEYKGMSLNDACNHVIMQKLKSRGGEGGLVAVDAKGNIAMPFNTEGMYRAAVSSSAPRVAEIYQ